MSSKKPICQQFPEQVNNQITRQSICLRQPDVLHLGPSAIIIGNAQKPKHNSLCHDPLLLQISILQTDAQKVKTLNAKSSLQRPPDKDNFISNSQLSIKMGKIICWYLLVYNEQSNQVTKRIDSIAVILNYHYLQCLRVHIAIRKYREKSLLCYS